MTPEGWRSAELGAIAQVNPEQLKHRTDPDYVLEYLDIAAIERPGVIGASRTLTLADAPSRARRRARAGDILVSTVRPYLRNFARVGEAPSNLVASTGYAVVRPANGVDGRFLYQHVLSDAFVEFLKPRMRGSNYPAVKADDVKTYTLSLPPLPEQRKIAAILSSVDDAIEKTQAVIDQVQVVKRGLMQDLLTRGLPGRHTRFKQTEVGEIPEEWSCVSLGSLVVDHNSGVYKKAALYGHGYNIVGVSGLYGCHSIDGQQFSLVPLEPNELSRYTLNEGDLLYAESSLVREGIARTLPVTRKGAGTAFAWHTRRVRLDAAKANAIFLHYVLDGGPARKRLMAVATQTALTGITTKDFFSVPVLVPSLDEQMKISEILTSHDEVADKCRDTVDELRAVKSALMSVLLNGELRVTPDPEVA